MPMTAEWYYTMAGQQAAAPASVAELRQLATSGQLLPHDLVWQEGMPNWAPASTIRGLFPTGRAKKRGRDDLPSSADAPGGLLGLHPLLVLLLSVLTLGLFALVYAYLVCSTYAAQVDPRSADAARPVGRLRHPLGVAVLCYLTLGLYAYYWMYQVMRECLACTGRRDLNPRIELTLMLLFPPYALFVAVFRLPELIAAARARAKLPESPVATPAYLFLVPCLVFALPLLYMALQDTLNQVWLPPS
ncbi:MAG: DUF4339 domain-containing protein [Gemmataceae bacterium]